MAWNRLFTMCREHVDVDRVNKSEKILALNAPTVCKSGESSGGERIGSAGEAGIPGKRVKYETAEL